MESHLKLLEEDLVKLYKNKVIDVEIIIPGASDDTKKEWISNELSKLLEYFENRLPAIGAVMGLPAIEELEENAVRLFVNWAWINLNDPKPSLVDTVDDETTQRDR